MRDMIQKIQQVLSREPRVVFAYLFGSFLSGKDFNDIDLGIYCTREAMEHPFALTSDLKIALSRATGLPPDQFDLVLINALMASDRMDSLLMLGEILEGQVLLDRDPEFRADLIEKVSSQFRESQGIIREALL